MLHEFIFIPLPAMPAAVALELLTGKGFMGIVTSPPKEMTFIILFVPHFFLSLNQILKVKKGNVVPGAAGWH